MSDVEANYHEPFRNKGLGNWEQGTGNREQGTGNREQGIGNKEQGSGIRERGTRNKDQGTGNRDQGLCSVAHSVTFSRSHKLDLHTFHNDVFSP